MSDRGNKMSNCDKTIPFGNNPSFPAVRITQYHFVYSFSTQWINPNRNAPFWRFYWNQTPGAVVVFNDKRIELSPDFIALIPPNTAYASDVIQPFNQFYMHFEWDWHGMARKPIILPLDKSKRQWVNKLEQWLMEGGSFLSLRLYSVLLETLRDIYHEDEDIPLPDPRITRALKLMDSMKKCSNGRIAETLCMSRDNFIRLFSRIIGVTPQHYMLGLRMEKAQTMLLQFDKTIDEVAILTGFSDRYQFSKKFKQYFGIPPATFRKKHQPEL